MQKCEASKCHLLIKYKRLQISSLRNSRLRRRRRRLRWAAIRVVPANDAELPFQKAVRRTRVQHSSQ
eukprot:2414029-Karenia_brevis.AAC.1